MAEGAHHEGLIRQSKMAPCGKTVWLYRRLPEQWNDLPVRIVLRSVKTGGETEIVIRVRNHADRLFQDIEVTGVVPDCLLNPFGRAELKSPVAMASIEAFVEDPLAIIGGIYIGGRL